MNKTYSVDRQNTGDDIAVDAKERNYFQQEGLTTM